MDNVKKALTFILTVLGLVIFYAVMMVKLEVMAQQTQANVERVSAQASWDDFLYDQAVEKVVKKSGQKNRPSENDPEE